MNRTRTRNNTENTDYDGSDTIRPEWTEILGVIVIVVVVEAVVGLIDVALVGVIDDHVGGGGELGVGEDLENLFK